MSQRPDSLFSTLPLPDLEECLSTAWQKNTLLCWHKGKAIHTRQWLTAIAATRALIAKHQSMHWVLCSEDSYQFSIGLIALLAEQRDIALPGNSQAGTLTELAEHHQAILSDKTVSRFMHSELIQTNTDDSHLAVSPPVCRIDPQATIVVYTSGSTGKPKAIIKKLRHFIAEAQCLEQLWGQQIDQCRVLSTISHQHIYGLLFRLLWPLLAGRPFYSHYCQYPEELLANCQHSAAAVLVSSPAFLSRLPDSSVMQQLNDKFSMVFSSGGPLANQHALAIYQHWQLPVTEVYGSSETGGIAWRRQVSTNAVPWQRFPLVDIQLDKDSAALLVKSPFVCNDDWFTTGDSAEFLSDQADSRQFFLRPRLDRTVKIEEKRVTLNELEERLGNHDYVRLARVFVMDGERQQLAAVIELSPCGIMQLKKSSKHAFNQTLRNYLAHYFDRVVLPRKWRYLDSLPFNSQGKINQQELIQLFMPKQKISEQASRMMSKVTGQEETEDGLILSLSIDKDLAFFPGHFPGHPIVPGVVQLKWAEHFGQRYFPIQGEFIRLEAVKFQHILGAGENTRLQLNYNFESHKLSFRFYDSSHRFSSGRMVFSGPQHDA